MVTSYFGSFNDIKADKFQSVLSFLGIDHLAIEVARDQIKDSNIVSRLTLSEREMKSQRIKKEVASQRKNYDLLIIEPTTAKTASFAARDNRVDCVRLYPRLGLHTFNKKYARRLLENEKIIELDISFYFQNYIARDLRPLMRILRTFETSKIPTWLTNLPDQSIKLRSYRGLQSLGRLLNLSNKQTNPRYVIERVKRNRKKINGEIPFPGVEIIGS